MVLNAEKRSLNFTILPEGTILRELAEEIAASSKEYVRPFIDLRRVAVLETIRQKMSEQGAFTYLVHGKKRGQALPDKNGTLINEDYIGLVIRRKDQSGGTQEDCVAISPIGRRNAGFVTRQEASAGLPYYDVLAQPKDDAVNVFNARRLRFDPVSGEDTYEAYIKKVMALLTCPSEKFGREYTLRRGKNGEYALVYRGKAIGAMAMGGIMHET